MRAWRRITRGVRALLRREAREAEERDIADEVRHYLDEAEAELIDEGRSPEEARRSVRLAYGDEATVRENVRGYGWEHAVETLAADVRHAARGLWRSPGFTTVAVLTLGLGIGAAAAIFSVVGPVLFEPLAYPGADRLVAVADRGGDGSPVPVTFGTYRELATRSRSFEALAVTRPWAPTVTGRGEPQRLEGERVSADYLRVLGVPPALGPGFEAAADVVGAPDVVILSDGLWRRTFGADSAIVGRSVRLDERPFTVVGVMSPSFETVPGHDADAWSLLQYDASLPSFDGREWGHHLDMVGRLRDGVDAETARAELDRIAAAPIAEVTRPPWASLAQGLSVTGLREAATVGARPTLLALLGAAVLLLGIACVNVTNLLLARGARRRGELAMRAALGATRRRVVRQLLTESLVLAILGGALGLVVAWLGIDALLALSPPGLPRLDAIRLDGSALGFALAVTTLVGVVAGLGPAVGPLRGQVHRDVRESSQRSVGSHLPARRALVVAEVALALVLLVGAGLLVRSLQRLFAVSPGFDPAHVVVMNVQTSSGRFADDAATHVFFDQALEAVRRVPGVVEAAWTSQLPLSGQSDGYGMSLEGSGPSEVLAGGFRYVVSPGYFRAMGIPLLEGRTLDERDEAGAPSAVVVAETFARAAFGDRDPIGERVHVGSQDGPWYTIVGVAGDVTQVSLGDERGSAFYVVPEQWYFADRARWLVVRGGSSGADLVPSIKRAVWSVDPDQAIVRASTMESLVASSEAQRRFAMTVLEAFAIVALVLAGVGLYGALAGSVAERTREIGVRAALGASSGRIVRLVVRQGMTLVGMGAALGLGVAVVASRALSALLFDVSPLDPLTYAGVVGILTTVAGLACWVPAARAAAVDPVRTLKTE